MISTLAFLLTASLGSTAQIKPVVLESTTLLPMWITMDLPAEHLVQRAPDQKNFDRMYSLTGKAGRVSIAGIYGQVSSNSRTNLDVLQKTFTQSTFDSAVERHIDRKDDFKFTSFVAGMENGWREFKARRFTVTLMPNDAEDNVVDVLFLTDGRRRAWSLVTRYYTDDRIGKAQAEQMLNSVQAFNKISRGSGADTFEAFADTKGKIKVEAKGTFLTEIGR